MLRRSESVRFTVDGIPENDQQAVGPGDLAGSRLSAESPMSAVSLSAASPASAVPVLANAEQQPEAGWVSHNGLRVNSEMRLSEISGKALDLTRSEFDLLLAIVIRQRRVISKNELALELRGDSEVGGYVSDSDRRAVEVHLANLRRKLNDLVSGPKFIETVRGVGYRLAQLRMLS